MWKKIIALLLAWIPYFMWRSLVSEHKDPLLSCFFFALMTSILFVLCNGWPGSSDEKGEK